MTNYLYNDIKEFQTRKLYVKHLPQNLQLKISISLLPKEKVLVRKFEVKICKP